MATQIILDSQDIHNPFKKVITTNLTGLEITYSSGEPLNIDDLDLLNMLTTIAADLWGFDCTNTEYMTGQVQLITDGCNIDNDCHESVRGLIELKIIAKNS